MDQNINSEDSVWALPFGRFIEQMNSPYETFLRLIWAPMIFSLVILFQYEDFIWWGWWGALSLAITLPMLIWAFSGIFFVNEKRISVSETLYIKDLMEVVIDVLEISFQLVKGAVWVLSQIIHGLWFLIRGFFSLIHHIFDAFD